MPQLPQTALAAEIEAFDLAGEVLEMIESVSAPVARREAHLVEQLSFLQARDNYKAFLLLLDQGEDVPAATLARALFEEAMRWAWVDEDADERRQAFLGEAARAHRLIAEAADEQGISGAQFFGPLVATELLPRAVDARRFPARFEDLMDWMPDRGMFYLQYRVLSQYVHSTLLAAASTAADVAGIFVNTRRLPVAARLTVIRNGVASMTFIFDFAKAGLSWPGAVPLNFALFSIASRMADITLPFAPASA
jgi:hypothetical protein